MHGAARAPPPGCGEGVAEVVGHRNARSLGGIRAALRTVAPSPQAAIALQCRNASCSRTTSLMPVVGPEHSGQRKQQGKRETNAIGDHRGEIAALVTRISSHASPGSASRRAVVGSPTIRCLVYSRVVFPVLVLQTRVSIQSGRSCFSICREPQLDAGHPLASQQRWCDQSYLPAICVAYRNHQGTGRNTASVNEFGYTTC